jgi:hypothetical protein
LIAHASMVVYPMIPPLVKGIEVNQVILLGSIDTRKGPRETHAARTTFCNAV